jgi:hypothetical protein
MRVNALKMNKKLNCHKKISLALILVFFLPAASLAAESAAKGSWDQWLDSAYQLTWHDQVNIKKWIAEKEVNVFDKSLDDFIREWEMRINAIPQDGIAQVVPEKAIKQLAIAQLLFYLKTYDLEYLKKAVDTMNSESLKAKRKLPEMAFWYHYIMAHYDMEKGNSEGFVQDVFHIWLDVILKIESAKYEINATSSVTTFHGFYRSTPYLYRNLANLVLQRAIVKRKLSDIDALGVIIWNLSTRLPPKGYGKWVEQVAKRISGPESDNFRLSFTVQLMEADKKRLKVENLFESEKNFSIIEKSLIDYLSHCEMLHGLAKTPHGRSTVLTKQLQLYSFVLSRLYEEGPHQAVLARIPILKRRKGKAWHEKNAVLDQAINMFDELAQISRHKNILLKNGFLSKKIYLAAMHELWRAIMNLGLDTALYYEHHIDPEKARNLQVNIPLLENALIRYLDFFARYANNGYQNIVPDNAYYGAVEAAELLSDIHFLSAQWEKGLKKYDLALARRIQAVEIFPFDAKNYYITAQRLTELGRLEKYKKYVVMQAHRIRNSDLIKASAVLKNKYLGNDLVRLQATVPEIIMRAPYSIVLQLGLQPVPQELFKRLALIEKEIQGKSYSGQLDAQTRNRIAELTQQLKQRLSMKENHTREDILSIIQDIDPLAALIEENQKSQAQVSSDEELSFGHDLFPSNLNQLVLELKQIKEECILLGQLPDMNELRDRLVFDVDHPFHTLLRKFYHENSPQDFNYLRLLRENEPKIP